MKRYIKAAIEPFYTLREWVNTFKGSPKTRIFITYDDSASFDYEYDFVQLQAYLNLPDSYNSMVFSIRNWYVVSSECTEDKTAYALVVEKFV
jgi:hypothetical protein